MSSWTNLQRRGPLPAPQHHSGLKLCVFSDFIVQVATIRISFVGFIIHFQSYSLLNRPAHEVSVPQICFLTITYHLLSLIFSPRSFASIQTCLLYLFLTEMLLEENYCVHYTGRSYQKCLYELYLSSGYHRFHWRNGNLALPSQKFVFRPHRGFLRNQQIVLISQLLIPIYSNTSSTNSFFRCHIVF